MIELYSYSLGAIFLIGLAVILIASEIGWRLGARSAGRAGGNVSTLESAILGLLALIIGFTFAMALTRFEARRAAVLNEANAIGTTALRARLLPEPHRTDILKLLKEYVQIRVEPSSLSTFVIGKQHVSHRTLLSRLIKVACARGPIPADPPEAPRSDLRHRAPNRRKAHSM